MKLFLAWSGPASQQLAAFMHVWLKSIVQAIQPFMSSKDIRQGQRWSNEIGAKLAEVDFALLCLTPTNLDSKWIHFEAGAVSKNIDTARVTALLFDVKPQDIEFPLQQFQHTPLTRDGLWALAQDINKLCTGGMLEFDVLKRVFDRAWSEVEPELEKIRKTLAEELAQKGDGTTKRPTEDVLSDMLTTQQGLAANLEALREEFKKAFPPRRLWAVDTPRIFNREIFPRVSRPERGGAPPTIVSPPQPSDSAPNEATDAGAVAKAVPPAKKSRPKSKK